MEGLRSNIDLEGPKTMLKECLAFPKSNLARHVHQIGESLKQECGDAQEEERKTRRVHSPFVLVLAHCSCVLHES